MWGWAWDRLANERGQLNLSGLLNTTNRVLGTVGNAANAANLLRRNPTTGQSSFSLGGLQVPTSLAGAGLLGAGLLSDKEPGEITEARQFLRNRFTSPTALSDQFSGQIGGLAQSYQPLLTQQRQRGIADISQRFAAAFPKTVGAQGPEFGALSRYITDEALPREQAVLGDIGRQLLTEQGRAAETILQTGKPDPLSQLSTLLGYDLLTRGQAGAGGQGGQGIVGTDGGTSSLGNLAGGLPSFQQGAGQLFSMAQQAGGLNALLRAQPQLLTQVGSLLGAQIVPDLAGTLTGIPGYAIMTSQGVAIPADAVNLATLGSAAPSGGGAIPSSYPGGLPGIPSGLSSAATAAKTGVDVGVAGPGLLGPAGVGSTQALLSSAGVAAVGFAIGRAIGGGVDRAQPLGGQASGAVSVLGGAAGAAATGFALGGPVGAVIGAIAGGIGGLTGERSARHERKQGQITLEAQQTAAARPQAETWLRQLDENAKQYPQQQAVAQRIAPQLQALIDANDPTIRGIIDRLRSAELSPRSAPNPFTTATGVGLPEAQQSNPPAPYLLNLLAGMAFDTAQGVDVNRQNPESVVGRIYSSETGKFDSAFESLRQGVQRIATAQQLWEQLLQRVGG